MSTDSPDTAELDVADADTDALGFLARPMGRALAAVAAIAVVATAAWALLNERGDDAVVASFAGDELTAGELNDILSTRPEAGDSPVGSANVAADEITGWLIVEAVDAELAARGAPANDLHEAEARTLFVDAPDVDITSAYGQQLLRLQTVLGALREYADTEARNAPVSVEPPEFLCSAHILLETEAEALDVIAVIEGGTDFAAAAIEFSTGPSGPNGGDLGCVDAATFVPEFTDGARANGVGVTPPVQSQFGWHVINVRSIGPLSTENHPEMAVEEVERTLIESEAAARDAINQEVFDEVVGRARNRVNVGVEIDPKYGTWDAEQSFVAPPTGVTG